MTEFKPLVSIVIPVYNGSRYLREAVDSALLQTYDNIEVLVINDGSGDGGETREIALSYGSKIRYFEKENGGVATALNLGISEMKGEYFSWLSHDDVYFPDKIEKQISYLAKQRTKDISVYGDFVFINESSVITDNVRIRHSKRDSIYSVLHGLINGCTLLVPKKVFDKYGCFDSQATNTQDYLLWFTIFRSSKIHHIPYYLVKSRIHPHQGSKISASYQKERDELYSKFLNDMTVEDIAALDERVSTFYYKMFFFLVSAGLKHAASIAQQKYEFTNELLFHKILHKCYACRMTFRQKCAYYIRNPRKAFFRAIDKFC